MRTTLAIDDDVLREAREIAAADGRSVGAVISDLARRALAPVAIRGEQGLPVFDVAPSAPVITSAQVTAALDDE
jgi:hypothetical protein